MKRLIQIGLATPMVLGLTAISASAAPFAPLAAPVEAVSTVEQVKHRRHHHEHYHRHYHEHRHYHLGTGVIYRERVYYGEGYNGYRPYYYYAPRSMRAPEFYDLDAPRFLYPEGRYRIFRDW
jgi:hypothetical protein